MISNVQSIPPQTKPKQFNTCLHKNTNSNSSILGANIYPQSAESASSKMSRLAASAAPSAANKQPTINPPMEAVIVNSIIYSKPSFCRISVDLDDMPVNKKTTASTNILKESCDNESNCSSPMGSKNTSVNFDAVSCLASMTASTSLGIGEDTKLYRMCTTLNGSMHHQISDLCDNIFAMAGFYSNTSAENDDDSFIEFAYKDGDVYCNGDDDDDDEEEEEDDEDDEEDFIDDEDNYSDEIDDDNDVVEFSYDCPTEPAPKLRPEKKVRFNDKPTVHILRTWTFAHRAARKGHWQVIARDRERFKLRIERTALTINPILESEHRQKIYEERFAHLCTENDRQAEVSAEHMESKETSNITESKKPHQKKKRKKKRFCKMGNKHYF